MVLLTATSHLTDYLVDGMMKSDLLAVTFQEIAKQITILATALAVMFFALMLGYNYLKKSFDSLVSSESDGHILDIKEASRTVIIIILITIYPMVIMPTINGFVSTVNSLTAPSMAQQDVYYSAIKKYYDAQEQTKEAERKRQIETYKKIINDNTNKFSAKDKEIAQQNLDNAEGSILNTITDGLTDIGGYFKAAITTLIIDGINQIAGLIKLIIGVLAFLLFKILLVLGPLALAVSIIPAYKGQADLWLGTTLGAGLVLTTMHVLDHIFFAIMVAPLSAGPEMADGESTLFIVLSIVLTVCYLMTFWITSKWIGKGDSGRFVTKFITLGAIAAGMGAGAMMAKGGGNSAVSGATNATAQSQKATQVTDFTRTAGEDGAES